MYSPHPVRAPYDLLHLKDGGGGGAWYLVTVPIGGKELFYAATHTLATWQGLSAHCSHKRNAEWHAAQGLASLTRTQTLISLKLTPSLGRQAAEDPSSDTPQAASPTASMAGWAFLCMPLCLIR